MTSLEGVATEGAIDGPLDCEVGLDSLEGSEDWTDGNGV